MSIWWSFFLTFAGVTGLALSFRRTVVGPVLGIAMQVGWFAYAVASDQWPFIVSALAYGSVYTYGLRRILVERRVARSELITSTAVVH